MEEAIHNPSKQVTQNVVKKLAFGSTITKSVQNDENKKVDEVTKYKFTITNCHIITLFNNVVNI